MCDIVGYVGRREALPILLTGLKRLEYPGNDSADLAVVSASAISLLKHTEEGTR